jgi:hypothetical protein
MGCGPYGTLSSSWPLFRPGFGNLGGDLACLFGERWGSWKRTEDFCNCWKQTNACQCVSISTMAEEVETFLVPEL